MRAHLGDVEARDDYQYLIDKAHDDSDKYGEIWLLYLREVVLRELLEEYLEGFEQYILEFERIVKEYG